MDKRLLHYVSITIDKAVQNNISITLHNKKYYTEGESNARFAGYFDSDGKELLVATGGSKRDWVEVFIHESCHMDQFLENSRIWSDSFNSKGDDKYSYLFEWLDGETYDKKDITLSANTIKALELDCEKRSVSKIVEFDLPIDLEKYIKKANSYILFYNFVKKHRVWSNPGKPPYSFKEIVELMPSDFSLNYKVLPRWYEDMIVEYCLDGDLEGAKTKAKNRRKRNKKLNGASFRYNRRFY